MIVSVFIRSKYKCRWNTSSNRKVYTQSLLLTKLLDGFGENLTSTKYAKIVITSPDTALRDISDSLEKDLLLEADSGERSAL